MKKNVQSILLFFALALLLMAGCKKDDEATKPEEVSSEVLQQEEKEEQKSDENDETKITIKDAIGREITLDKAAERAIADSPNTMRIYTYVMGAEKLIGIPPRDVASARRMPYAMGRRDEFMKLKHFGGSYNVDNLEEILMEKPDVFFSSHKEKADYEELSNKIKAPVIALDQGPGVVFDPILYDSIRIVGKVMNREDRAEEVVQYMEGLKKDLYDRTKDIPENEKSTVYAGGLAWNGPHGIEGTRENYPIFDVVHAKNVVTGLGKDGLVEIDKEKLLEWNPDFIFIDLASIDIIQDDFNKNPDYYKSLKAFKEGKIFAQLPFVWCNVNVDTAMANAYYVGKIVYPEQFKDIDPVKKADEIYEFLVGRGVYDELAKEEFGGFQQISIEDFEANKFFIDKTE